MSEMSADKAMTQPETSSPALQASRAGDASIRGRAKSALARAASLSPERRREIAPLAALKRWAQRRAL